MRGEERGSGEVESERAPPQVLGVRAAAAAEDVREAAATVVAIAKAAATAVAIAKAVAAAVSAISLVKPEKNALTEKNANKKIPSNFEGIFLFSWVAI